jgi:DNA-binding SARP family transcriptional activator
MGRRIALWNCRTGGESVLALRVKVLGPMEMAYGGRAVAFAGPGQRALLAMLVLELDRVVPVDRLVDTIWDARPPATARNKIQIHVSALRREMGQSARDPGGPLRTSGTGYMFSSEGVDLDLAGFDTALSAGRTAFEAGRLAVASELFADALALWHGPAFADVASPVIRRAAAALEERRLLAVEAKAESDLGMGRSEAVAAELPVWLASLPLRERMRGLLMTGLYRLGCRADALALYRDGRRIMTTDLGLEPCLQLRVLHQRILADDTGLLSAHPVWPENPGPGAHAAGNRVLAGGEDASPWPRIPARFSAAAGR